MLEYSVASTASQAGFFSSSLNGSGVSNFNPNSIPFGIIAGGFSTADLTDTVFYIDRGGSHGAFQPVTASFQISRGGSIDMEGHITASGNVSASGDIVANKVTADVVDTSFETFLNFETASAFTYIAPFPMTINFTGSSTSSMDIAGFVTASANTSTFSVQQTPPITLNIFDKLKITPSSSGLFTFSGSRTI